MLEFRRLNFSGKVVESGRVATDVLVEWIRTALADPFYIWRLRQVGEVFIFQPVVPSGRRIEGLGN